MRRLVLSGLLAAGCVLGSLPNGQASPDAVSTTPAPSVAPAAPRKGRLASEAVKKELTDIIDAQLAAFRSNDYAKAFTFASAELRGIFAPDEFERMVKTAYPVIAHSESVTYGPAFDTGEEAVVNVRVQNSGKGSAEYHYLFKKEAGGWKISGVTEIKAEGLSV